MPILIDGSGGIPPGCILLWSGSTGNIPAGWALCNGSNGTPDLRNRFVVGAGSTYAVGATGGVTTVTLSASQIPSHTHSFSATGTTSQDGEHSHKTQMASYGSGGSQSGGASQSSGSTDKAGLHTHTLTLSGTTGAAGSGSSHENRPPYYALCYIMKL